MQQEVRLIKIIGEDNLNRLKKSKVLIVGIGGVGGSAFEMLVRSSIGTIGTIKCSCGGETFIDVNTSAYKCMDCGKDIRRYPTLKVKKYNVVLAPGQKLYACHVIHDSDDYKEINGEIITSRNEKNC